MKGRASVKNALLWEFIALASMSVITTLRTHMAATRVAIALKIGRYELAARRKRG
jgi:hypothetical protein